MQERLASNLTDDQWLSAYYRYYKYDLNKTIPNATKSRRKPSLDIRLKSKRRKFEQQKYQQQQRWQQHQESNAEKTTDAPILPKDLTTTTTTAGSILEALRGTTSLVTVETTTAGITKSIDELQPNIGHTTSEIDTNAQIDSRMNVNDTATSRIIETLSTTSTTIPSIRISTMAPTTEHSITYNVTVNDLKRVPAVHKLKSRRLSNAGWGRWQKWTKCSRSCGGGVMSQSRLCLSR